MNDLFIRACKKKSVEYTPIWLMRQAGRYIPEYRELRKSHSIKGIYSDPEMSSEVSAMPIDMFGLDAAIIFEDLMTPLEPAGIEFELVNKVGPVIGAPIRNRSDVEGIKEYNIEDLGFVSDTVKMLKGKVDVPVIGFAGGPFTMACYLVDGAHKEGFRKTGEMISRSPEVFRRLMEKLTGIITEYIRLQIRAGADAIQIFDTWCGILDEKTYADFVMPYSKRIFDYIRRIDDEIPRIHFSLDSAGISRDIVNTGCSIIGIDWKEDIGRAWEHMGFSTGIQGNLNPGVLAGGGQHMIDSALDILKSVAGRKGHIFNLGHGVLPITDPKNVKALVDAVHSFELGNQ